MKVLIREKTTGTLYNSFDNVARVATRKNPCVDGIIDIIVYSGGHGYAYLSSIYDVEILA